MLEGEVAADAISHGEQHMRTYRWMTTTLLATALAVAGCENDGPQLLPPTSPPGALVRLSVSGTVGVLLEDLPASVRDRAAEELAAKPDEFWIKRAARQMSAAKFRLLFRPYYYLDDPTKGQLPLPPEELWNIQVTGTPARGEVDGHDVVTVTYDFESYLLTPPDSPGASEPAIADPGGTYEETFVLPLDPELVFQRTGYACMDEYQYPYNSVDGENALNFYDDTCDVEVPSLLVCHLPDNYASVTESCVDAVKNHIGRSDTVVHFEHLEWDPALADQVRLGEVTNPLGADLAALTKGTDEHRIIYRYIAPDSCALAEGCVGGVGWRRLLQFTGSARNDGQGPMHVGNIDFYMTGDESNDFQNQHIFEYSPCHQHYHFNHYGDFTISAMPDAPDKKRAFCLISTSRYSNNENTPLGTPYTDCVYQGIAAGWGDDYVAGLECQWLDITDLDTSAGPVTTDLTFEINPRHLLCEGEPILDENGNPLFEPSELTTEEQGETYTVGRPMCNLMDGWDANNKASSEVVVPQTGGLVTSACENDTFGPLRDCGFTEAKAPLSCAPGAPVKVQCQVNPSAPPQVVRVCETSAVLGGTACAHRFALANEVIEGETTLDMTCPAARGAPGDEGYEPGGLITVYTTPAWPADDAAPVTCTVVPQ